MRLRGPLKDYCTKATSRFNKSLFSNKRSISLVLEKVCEATKVIHSTKKFILFQKYCLTIPEGLHTRYKKYVSTPVAVGSEIKKFRIF